MNKSSVDLVGVGLNATDTLIYLEEYPSLGSKVEYRRANVLPGGQVATAVVACQRWGMRTRYVGKFGDDDAAEVHRKEFAAAGVEARLITVPDCISHQSLILVDRSGERTVFLRRDDRLILFPGEFESEWITHARVLHIDGCDTEAAKAAAGWARSAGIPVVADLDDTYPGVEDLLEKIDYLIVSRDFPLRLLEENDLEKALCQMQARFRCRFVAATLGQDGVLAWDGDRFYYVAAYRVPVVDTTGSGDIFHAGFIYGLLQGWPPERRLEFGCAAAALNCTAIGARGGIQTVEEIEHLMASGTRHDSAYPH